MRLSACLNRSCLLAQSHSIENIEAIDSPAIAVYPDRIEENIRQALALVSADRKTFLRPHVKTHKTQEVVQMMQQQGIDRFKCSTIAEAEMLGMTQAADVLLAYQPTHLKADRLLQLQKAYPNTRFSCLVDNPATAEHLSEVFADHPLPVYIDLDVGMHRTGISPHQAPALIKACSELKGISVVGLHAYDGHIHASDYEERKQAADKAYSLVTEVQQRQDSQTPLTVVIGGSPTFSIHAQRHQVECSPGTFPLWDAGYAEAFPDLSFQWAAVVLTRVISIIDDHKLCLDVGSKAVAADAVWPRIIFPDRPEAEAVSQSEEHLVMTMPNTAKVSLGEVWWGVPIHICPTVNLYPSLHVIRNGRWEEDWQVAARTRKITI